VKENSLYKKAVKKLSLIFYVYRVKELSGNKHKYKKAFAPRLGD